MKSYLEYLIEHEMEEESHEGLTLYHGTNKNVADHLIKNGWQPRESGYSGNMGNPRYLYLTSDPENAMWYANEIGGDVVLEVRNIPIEYLIPDPEDEAGFTINELLNRMKKISKMPSNFALTQSINKNHFRIL